MFALTRRGELPQVVELELEQLIARLRSFLLTAHSEDGTIAPDSIDYSQFAPATGLSVIGRSVATTGTVGDIVATADHQVLRRSGSTLGFGTITGEAFGPQPANYVLIGPASGVDATPTFRSLSGITMTPAQVMARVMLRV